MTIIVWDGKSLAADRQGTRGDLRVLFPKIKKTTNVVGKSAILAHSGSASHTLPLFNWWEAGAEPSVYPEFQKDEETGSVLVVASGDTCVTYTTTPYPMQVLDTYGAWGSGRDFAYGALAMGADAKTAVEIAILLCPSCGMGYEVFPVQEF